MPANVQTLGPGHVFVRFRGNSTANYLGTAEIAPRIEKQYGSLEVKNDLASRQFPFQRVDDGEIHVYSCVLSRYDYLIMRALQDRYAHQAAFTNQGIDSRFKRGSLVMGIGDVQLIHVNDFTGVQPTHPLATADQPPGRLYYSANLMTAADDAGATRANFIPLVFQCDALYDPTTRQFFLYSEVPSNFGSLGPIT